MDPDVGVRTPDKQSKSVVFPAPFGPMRPHTSPAKNETLTDESARTPPKVTVTASVRKMAACSALATAAGYPATVHASGRPRVAVLRFATVNTGQGEGR